MHRLTIRAENLVPFRLGDIEEKRRCLLGHILVAAGEDDPQLEYPAGRWPPAKAASLYTKRGAIRADVCARVVNAFDNGHVETAIAALRDYGWDVRIVREAQ